MGGVYAEALSTLNSGVRADAGRSIVDRVVGLLAGRARCRVEEAHRHLLRMAAERQQDVAEVAADLIRHLDTVEAVTDRGPPETVARLMTAALTGVSVPAQRSEPSPETMPLDTVPLNIVQLNTVQRVLDSIPGMSVYLVAERDGAGRLSELVWAAVSPGAVTPDGRRGTQLLGLRTTQHFPEVIGTERWIAYQSVLHTGHPIEVGPISHGDTTLSVRVHRLGPGLMASWTRHPDRGESGRQAAEREAGRRRLAEVEDQLAEQRRSLAAEHALAAQLQQIILPIPDGPIELPGLKVALRYLPAGQESLVGGDWYHAAELRDGSVLLAVGDVAGHGTQAATTMAQLRHALRALAVVTGDPGVLLGHLNRLTCELGLQTPELAATAVIARFDPGRREIVWAQAGHPPPLLSRDGRTAPLGRPPGSMLGVVDDATYLTARLDFRIGDLLLLYTDGLVEHRARGLDDGLATVIAAVDEAVRAAPQQPLAQVLARLQQANPDDDTCILAARPVTGDTRDLRRFRTGR